MCFGACTHLCKHLKYIELAACVVRFATLYQLRNLIFDKNYVNGKNIFAIFKTRWIKQI